MMYANSNIEYKYQSRKYQTTHTAHTTQPVKKNKKRRTTNKAKEVEDWDDMSKKETPKNNNTNTNNSNNSDNKNNKNKIMIWVPGTIPIKSIREMKWGDLNELSDEEYGYFKICESS